MSALKKKSPLDDVYNTLYQNPLNHSNPNPKHSQARRSRTLGYQLFGDSNNKENLYPPPPHDDDTNRKQQQHNQFDSSDNVWDQYSDSEAAPASSWSALPNRYLLCRPLPVDIGSCTCVIVKEPSASLYSLYTHEGHGRRDRKLAVASHTRRTTGCSEFTVAHNSKGLSSISDETILGTITANFMGSKYHIWDQANSLDPHSKLLVAVVGFVPTITTCTGSFRSLRAWIPKHQSMQFKTTSKIQHIYGLSHDWEANAQPLYSRVPHYNSFSRQYELDFRQKGRAGNKVQSSVKNFQLTVEENGRHSILQLGKVGKSKYVMEYRYPLTGYQAFCICLASIDTKLCCTI